MSFEDVPPGRRRIMRAVRSSETKPEAIVRSRLHRLGFRFRKNVRTLPGKPDIVFVARQKVIFVHGCFWHQHSSCGKITQTKVRTDYWRPKLAHNVVRDGQNIDALRQLGWDVLVIWECEINENLEASISGAVRFLES